MKRAREETNFHHDDAEGTSWSTESVGAPLAYTWLQTVTTEDQKKLSKISQFAEEGLSSLSPPLSFPVDEKLSEGQLALASAKRAIVKAQTTVAELEFMIDCLKASIGKRGILTDGEFLALKQANEALLQEAGVRFNTYGYVRSTTSAEPFLLKNSWIDVTCDCALRSRAVRPLHPPRKYFGIDVTRDSGLRSTVVSPLHPYRKNSRIDVTCDSGLRSRAVRPLHPSRKYL